MEQVRLAEPNLRVHGGAMRHGAGKRLSCCCGFAAVWLLCAAPVQAQTGSPPSATPPAADTAPPDGNGGPVVKDSSVGYIDSAVPFSHFRFRYDSAWRDVRPYRAEFFYAQGGPGNPG